MIEVLVLVVVSIVLIVLLFCWYKFYKSLRIAPFPSNKTPKSFNIQYETHTFKTEDNVTLQGWYVPVKDAKAVVIIVHGYLNVKGTVAEHIPYLFKAGYSTFTIDLRSDLPNGKATIGVKEYKDIAAAYDYMKSLPENEKKKIGFFGGSMGASSSIITTGKTGKGDFLIASVPFANYKSLYSQRLKLENLPSILLPFTLLAGIFELGVNYPAYAPDNFIRKIRVPILFIAAAKDLKVDFQDAKNLYAQANEPKYLWTADTHHDVYREEPEEYEKKVLEFLKNVGNS